MTEDEMVGWHHQLEGHEFEQALGIGDRQGDLGSISGSGRPLENEVAIHSSTIAWKIPWTEEPGRLQTMGSRRVGHN